MTAPPPRRPRIGGARTRLLAPVVALAVLLGACGGDGDEPAAPTTSSTPPSTTAAAEPTTSTTEPIPEYRSFVAQAKPSVAEVAVHESPGGPTRASPDGGPQRIANPNENGVPAVFLVVGREKLVEGPDGSLWHHVHLPVRPNGSSGWIRADDVDLSFNDYRITVEIGRKVLTVYEAGEVLREIPVATGKDDTPTPGGVFYLKELLQPPTPDGPYGSYAYGLSGFSNTLETFRGGEAVIGIHGTNEPELIGTEVSSGCIRMRNEDIEALVEFLPLGVPVEILA